jgi:hypothetical protein
MRASRFKSCGVGGAAAAAACCGVVVSPGLPWGGPPYCWAAAVSAGNEAVPAATPDAVRIIQSRREIFFEFMAVRAPQFKVWIR